MTNREWLNTLSDEEFARAMDAADYCRYEYREDEYACEDENCYKCCMKWLKKKHEMKMPELKAGMFIFVDKIGRGLIVENSCNNLVVFQNGTWEKLENVPKDTISRVYNSLVKGYESCIETSVLWKRELK